MPFWRISIASFISIGEIALKAGVNRSTYYRNFKSKEALIKVYFNKIIHEYLEDIKKATDISLDDYLPKMFSHFFKYKKELLRIYKSGKAYLILDALTEIFIELAAPQTFEEQKSYPV